MKINKILDEIKKGHCVLICDDHDREDEADLFMAAEFIDVDKINFFLNQARGLITHPISEEVAQKIKLPLMVLENAGSLSTAFTVSIDASFGITSGISSKDRAYTIKKLSDPKSIPSDFIKPGHVFPLIAHSEGFNARLGHTEAAIELLKLADLYPVGVLCETLNQDGMPLRKQELMEFAKLHKLQMISIEEIKNYLISTKSIC